MERRLRGSSGYPITEPPGRSGAQPHSVASRTASPTSRARTKQPPLKKNSSANERYHQLTARLHHLKRAIPARAPRIAARSVQLLDDLDDLQTLTGSHAGDLLALEGRAQEAVATVPTRDTHTYPTTAVAPPSFTIAILPSLVPGGLAS